MKKQRYREGRSFYVKGTARERFRMKYPQYTTHRQVVRDEMESENREGLSISVQYGSWLLKLKRIKFKQSCKFSPLFRIVTYFKSLAAIWAGGRHGGKHRHTVFPLS